jgi:molybdate transport system permease protein
MNPLNLRLQWWLIRGLGAALVVLLVVPLLSLVLAEASEGFFAGLASRLVMPALRISILSSCVSVAIVVCLGTPLAWCMARSQKAFSRSLELLLELPIVVPPAVAGVALLLALGKQGLLSRWIYPPGWSIAFTTTAVVIAQIFIAAPLYLQAAISAFRRVDNGTILAARALGASPLRVLTRVAIPLAAPGLRAGAALTWARALGEFGATLMFAGNLQGETQTLPLAIYTALESDLRAARSTSVLLVFIALATLALARMTGVRAEQAGRP